MALQSNDSQAGERRRMADISELADEVSRGHSLLARGVAFLAVLLLIAIAYMGLFRPYQLLLGATAAEIERPMPGDELNRDPSFLATRAITIAGTSRDVWP